MAVIGACCDHLVIADRELMIRAYLLTIVEYNEDWQFVTSNMSNNISNGNLITSLHSFRKHFAYLPHIVVRFDDNECGTNI